MREHDLELLELPAVLARLGAATASEPGAALAEALRPSPDCRRRASAPAADERGDLADRGLRRARPRRRDRRERGGRARGARQHARHAHADAHRAHDPGGRDGAPGARRAGRHSGTARTSWPTSIRSLLSIAEEIGRTVEEDGSDLRDSASPELRRLRRVLRDGRGRLAERLRKIARDPALAEYLQDDFVTERGGRPVLALRASARGRVPGIVHDSSGSGQTLFVEPFAAVDDSNRLREAEVAERDEVTRILRNLSSLVGAQAGALASLVAATASLDLALACGSLSRSWRGAVVTAERRCRPARSAPSAPRPVGGRPDRPRARRAPRARDQRAEHRRQDRRAEDARARRRPAPVRAPPAGSTRPRSPSSTRSWSTSATSSRSR